MIASEHFIIPANGEYLVYAPLRRIAFFTNRATANFLMECRNGNYDFSRKDVALFAKFLSELGLLNKTGDAPVAGLYQGMYQPNEITLLLTNQCNLRCTYCYAMTGSAVVKRMPLETAIRGIDFIVQSAVRSGADWMGVHYHSGGEPTLNFDVLTGSFRYAEEQAGRHKLRLYSSIATNGVLPSKRKDWIIANLGRASISLDGPPNLHDLNRPTCSGAGSGSQVLQTIQAFDQARFKYGIRITISAQTVEQLPEIIRFVMDTAHPQAVKVEPVYHIGRGKELALQPDIDLFIDGFREGKKIAAAKGVPLHYSAARLDTLSIRFCRAFGEGFTLTPDGQVTGCLEVYDETADFAEEFIFGKFNESHQVFTFDADKLDRLRRHNVENQSYCSQCFARWHCSGDCPNKVRRHLVGGEFRGMPSCQMTQSILVDELTGLIQQSGGLIWKG